MLLCAFHLGMIVDQKGVLSSGPPSMGWVLTYVWNAENSILMVYKRLSECLSTVFVSCMCGGWCGGGVVDLCVHVPCLQLDVLGLVGWRDWSLLLLHLYCTLLLIFLQSAHGIRNSTSPVCICTHLYAQ